MAAVASVDDATVAQAAATTTPGDAAVAQLVAMGISRAKALKALHDVGQTDLGQPDLEAALDFVYGHSEQPDEYCTWDHGSPVHMCAYPLRTHAHTCTLVNLHLAEVSSLSIMMACVMS